MNAMLYLIPISLALLGIAVATFSWALRSGQFDDIDSAPLEMLESEDAPRQPADAD